MECVERGTYAGKVGVTFQLKRPPPWNAVTAFVLLESEESHLGWKRHKETLGDQARPAVLCAGNTNTGWKALPTMSRLAGVMRWENDNSRMM